MLGMVQGKGGDQQVEGQQPMGADLASLFANNGPASGGAPGMPIGMPGTPGLPQITQPPRPTIAPPMARPIPPAPSVLPPKPAAAPNPFPNTLKMNPVERARHRAGGR